MQALSNKLSRKQELLTKREEIIDGLEQFHKSQFELFKGRDTNKTKVLERIYVLDDYLSSFIND